MRPIGLQSYLQQRLRSVEKVCMVYTAGNLIIMSTWNTTITIQGRVTRIINARFNDIGMKIKLW